MKEISNILLKISVADMERHLATDQRLRRESGKALAQAVAEHEPEVSNYVAFEVPGYPPLAAVVTRADTMYVCNLDLLCDFIIDVKMERERVTQR